MAGRKRGTTDIYIDQKKVDDVLKKICSVIRKERDVRDISRDELSRLSRVTPSAIYFIEKNDHVPNLESTLKICASLRISLDKYIKEIVA